MLEHEKDTAAAVLSLRSQGCVVVAGAATCIWGRQPGCEPTSGESGSGVPGSHAWAAGACLHGRALAHVQVTPWAHAACWPALPGKTAGCTTAIIESVQLWRCLKTSLVPVPDGYTAPLNICMYPFLLQRMHALQAMDRRPTECKCAVRSRCHVCQYALAPGRSSRCAPA